MLLLLRRFLGKAPLLLPALCVLFSISSAATRSPIFIILLSISLAVCFYLQGKRGLITSLILSLSIGYLHHERITSQQKWEEIFSHHQTITFQGSVIRDIGRSFLIEGMAVLPTAIPSTPSLIQITPHPGHNPEIGKQYTFLLKKHPSSFQQAPGAFDSQAWKYSLGISSEWDVIEVLNQENGSLRSRILRLSFQWNSFLLNRIDHFFPPDSKDPATIAAGEITKSLILGSKKETSQETLDAFRLSGLLHIFAVSGLHVGIIALLITLVLLVLRLRPISFSLIMGICLIFYDFSTGFSISANRATLMILLYLTASSTFRQSHPFNRLAFTLIILLAWDSRALFQLSFQLSFLVFTIVILAAYTVTILHTPFAIDPFIPKKLYTVKEKLHTYFSKGILSSLWISLCAWIAASLVLIPFIHYYSPFAPVANTLLSPLIPLLMGSGILLIITGNIPGLGDLFLLLTKTLSSLLLGGAQTAANVPYAAISFSTAPAASSLSIYPTYGSSYAAVMGNPAVLLECGSEASARNIIFPSLRKEGYAPRILAFSHFHKHQAEGINFLNNREHFTHILSPPHDVPGKKNHPLPQASYPLIKRGQKWNNGNGGTLTILDCPDKEDLHNSKSADDFVLIFLWEYERKKVLFLSDAGYSSEQRLKKYYPDLTADIIILGKHNSDLPVSREYLSSLGASIIIHSFPYTNNLSTSSIHTHYLEDRGSFIIDLSR